MLSGRIAKRRPLTSTSFTPHVVSSIRSMVWRASWMSISSAARVSMRLWMLLDSHCVSPPAPGQGAEKETHPDHHAPQPRPPQLRAKYRYIPACAGETRPEPESPGSTSVHPRVCGGNKTPRSSTLHTTGTSPRVRGKLHRPAIPPTSLSVHPRVCGGNMMSFKTRMDSTGTSPRVRGKRLPQRQPASERRYIPACAGETVSITQPARSGKVHPRVCGGNDPMLTAQERAIGTSPRVRGKHPRSRAHHERARYIPACAGETSRPPPRASQGAVHPRVCGGNSIAING